MQKQPDGSRAPTRDIPILCRDRVNHVGDAVAFVVADSRALAQDAAELIEVDYDAEDAAAGDRAPALDRGHAAGLAGARHQPRLHLSRSATRRRPTPPSPRRPSVVGIEFVNNRLVCNYMEARSAIGEWKPDEDRFVLTTGSQGVHSACATIIARKVFKIEPEKLRVITPDVGGGFGPKGFVYREYPLVLEAAKRLGPAGQMDGRPHRAFPHRRARPRQCGRRPRWRWTRTAASWRCASISSPIWAPISRNTARSSPISAPPCRPASTTSPALDVTITGVYTNTCPVDAYRGAGRPEAAFLLEKLVDACARDLGIGRGGDPAAQLHQAGAVSLPHPDRPALRCRRVRRPYDAGHGARRLGRASTQRLAQSKARGKIRGIGMATYIEACAFPGSEPAHVKLNDDGTVTLSHRHPDQRPGPRHRLCPVRRREARHRHRQDHRRTRATPTDLKKGGGTGGSRSIPLGGVSAARAGEDLAEKIKAHRRRRAGGLGRPTSSWSTARRASSAPTAPIGFADDRQGGRRSRATSKASASSSRTSATYPNGTHICEVEIDPETGGDRDRQLHDRRRFRRHGEPDPARRPGPWRRRPGHRPGA